MRELSGRLHAARVLWLKDWGRLLTAHTPVCTWWGSCHHVYGMTASITDSSTHMATPAALRSVSARKTKGQGTTGGLETQAGPAGPDYSSVQVQAPHRLRLWLHGPLRGPKGNTADKARENEGQTKGGTIMRGLDELLRRDELSAKVGGGSAKFCARV